MSIIDLTLQDLAIGDITAKDLTRRHGSDLARLQLDPSVRILGTLDELLAVIGRAHEQLLAIQAARQTVPARAVLGSDGALRLETTTGHGLGWLDTGTSQGFEPGDELLIQRHEEGWSFVRWVDTDDVATEPLDGYVVVPVIEGTDG
jgi:hypothetical protein